MCFTVPCTMLGGTWRGWYKEEGKHLPIDVLWMLLLDDDGGDNLEQKQQQQ